MKINRSHTTPQFEEDFLGLSATLREKVRQKIQLFETNCFHNSLETHKLKGILGRFWSFSINNEMRVIFRFLPNREAIYYRIGPHRIYREMERWLK